MMKKRVLAAGLSALLLSGEAFAMQLPFTDVSGDSWYYDSVQYAYDTGLFEGVSDTEFEPDGRMTRGMFMTVLGRLAGFEDEVSETAFSDVPKDKYYAKYIQNAYESGIIAQSKKFYPDEPITREDMALYLANYYRNIEKASEALRLDYTDYNEISERCMDGVMYCTAQGIMQGREDGRFDPKGTATRAEVATVFMNAANRKKDWGAAQTDLSEQSARERECMRSIMQNGPYEKGTPQQRLYDMLLCINDYSDYWHDTELFESFRLKLLDAKDIKEFTDAVSSVYINSGVNTLLDITAEQEENKYYPSISFKSAGLGNALAALKDESYHDDYIRVIKEYLKHCHIEYTDEDVERAYKIQLAVADASELISGEKKLVSINEIDEGMSNIPISKMLEVCGFENVTAVMLDGNGNLAVGQGILAEENLTSLKINALITLGMEMRIASTEEEFNALKGFFDIGVSIHDGVEYTSGIYDSKQSEVSDGDMLSAVNLNELKGFLPYDYSAVYMEKYPEDTEFESMSAYEGYIYPTIIPVDEYGTYYHNIVNIYKNRLSNIITLCKNSGGTK